MTHGQCRKCKRRSLMWCKLECWPGVGCAEATNALPRPRVAPATGQDSTTLPHRSCEGRHVLSRGQPVQRL